jgi:hypothetical protein
MLGILTASLLILIPGLLLALVQLCGCRFAGDAGGASGAATANPAVGVAVGVGVQAGLDATVSYFVRKRQQAEQDAIATEVATLDNGESRSWKVEHDIPIGNEHGEVQVTRVFNTPLTLCKEIVFSIESDGDPPTRQTYTAGACRNGDRWKWALAEPTVERWGALQ